MIVRFSSHRFSILLTSSSSSSQFIPLNAHAPSIGMETKLLQVDRLTMIWLQLSKRIRINFRLSSTANSILSFPIFRFQVQDLSHRARFGFDIDNYRIFLLNRLCLRWRFWYFNSLIDFFVQNLNYQTSQFIPIEIVFNLNTAHFNLRFFVDLIRNTLPTLQEKYFARSLMSPLKFSHQ